MDPYYTFRIPYFPLDFSPLIDLDHPVIGKRKALTEKERAKRKARKRMAKKSKNRNRR